MNKRLFKTEAKTRKSVFRSVCVFIGILTFFSPLPVSAENTDMMLSEKMAIQLGLERPEFIQQMNSFVQLAESDIIEAGTWKNPEFSYDQESSNNGPDDTIERSYMLSQEFDLSGKKEIKALAAKQRLEAAKLEISGLRIQRAAEIRKKFYDVLYHQDLRGIYDQWRSGMDSLKAVMQKRKNAGDISRYDLDRLKQEMSLIRAENTQNIAEQERLWQELAAGVGQLNGKTSWTGVTGSLFPKNSLSLEMVLEQAEKQPDLMATQLQAQAFATDERFTGRWWLPDPTLGLGYKGIENAKGDAWLLNVSLPIPVFNRNADSILKAQANRHLLQNKHAQALADRKGTIRGLWHQEKTLAGAVKSLSQEDSTALLETAETAYKAGEIGVLEILDAYRSAFEHREKRLSLMREARMVRIELELITGGSIQ